MEKDFEKRKFDWKGIIIAVILMAFNIIIYPLVHLISQWLGITPMLLKIEVIDNAMPYLPIFIIPYVLAYIYWTFTPMVAYKCDKKHYKNFLAGFLIANIIGILLLIFIPTYMDRISEGLMVEKTGLLNKLCLFIYNADGGNTAFNLFPSFHCLLSVIFYLSVAGRKEVPLWYRICSLILTILICLATLFIKQHYILDFIVGISLALISFFVAKIFNLGRIFDKVIK